MAFNKVIYEGETLIDLTGDTVTPDTLMVGTTAHAANGEVISGTATGTVTTDKLLVTEGAAADAKAVGDRLLASENRINDLEAKPSINNLHDDYEYSLTQVSRNGTYEGYEIYKNYTTGRSSFTNGQSNRNGGYFSIVTGQTNILPRLFKDKEGIAWGNSSSNLVCGSSNTVLAGNTLTGGASNIAAGGRSLVVGYNNKDWVRGKDEAATAKQQTTVAAYKNYVLYGADDSGNILDKDGNATTDNLQGFADKTLDFYIASYANSIIGGSNNDNRSYSSIISGADNINNADNSLVLGSKNTINTTGYTDGARTKQNYILGANNTTLGSNIYIFGENCNSNYDYTYLTGQKHLATNKYQAIFGYQVSPTENSIFSVGHNAGSLATGALEVTRDNFVLIKKAPTQDNHALRYGDITTASINANFYALAVKGDKVITTKDLSSGNLAEVTPSFNAVLLKRPSTEALSAYSALRVADISTHGSSGASYAALPVKFSKINMKNKAGTEGTDGSTVIEPDKITTNEIAVNDITGNISRLATANKNIVDAINEVNDKVNSGSAGIVDSNLTLKNGEGKGCLVTKTGDGPEVDFINYAQHDGAVALGDLNRADGRKSVALGTQNNVTSYIPVETRPYYVDAIADGNIYYLAEDKSKYILVDSTLSEESYNNIEILYNYVRAQANSSIAVGQVNTVYGNCGGAFGSTNTLDINGGHSFVFGKNNYLDSYRSFVAGENNRGEGGKYHQFILGDNNTALGDKEILLGTGLKSSATYQTTVGKFNEDKPDALFVVGAGGSDDARRNIFEVEHHLANLNGTLNINDHFNVSGNSTLKGNLSVRANPDDKNVESFYVNKYGAYDIGGKLSNASNINNGDATGSLVVAHVSNAKANKATGIGSLVGGSANFWQEENNSVSGANSIAWGYKTTVTTDYSYGLGWGINIKNGAHKLAYGIYNEDKANTVFEIGKGTNDTDRKNIFEILNDGSISMNDIMLTSTNLQKLLTLIANLSDEKVKALNDFAQALEVTEGAQ
jgi:hypothetical protein